MKAITAVFNLWGKYPPHLPADDRREWPGLSPNYVSRPVESDHDRERRESYRPHRPTHTYVLGLKGDERRAYIAERNVRVVNARARGETYSSIAKREHISRDMARVIYEKSIRYRMFGYYWGA